jgi:hypothetical protein
LKYEKMEDIAETQKEALDTV